MVDGQDMVVERKLVVQKHDDHSYLCQLLDKDKSDDDANKNQNS